MKTLGNLFIAIGTVALGLPTLVCLISEHRDGPLGWLISLGNNNPIFAIAVGGGSLMLILVGIIIRNIKGKKKINTDQQALQQQIELQQQQIQQLQQQNEMKID
jgi:hypothetical protein